ncbi:hypothetical protein V8C42DRAFT_277830 [Trichoderma barbatum]
MAPSLMARQRFRDGGTRLLPARELRMPGLDSWFLANILLPCSQAQSLRYSCVSVSGCSPIFPWSLILRIILSTSQLDFLFSILRPARRRAASGEVDGIGLQVVGGQSLGAEKPTFYPLDSEGCP